MIANMLQVGSTGFLPMSVLRANDYNPNRMSDIEFTELVTELHHLQRLPKPIVVRPDGIGYVIVDGEHNWRAAQEAGFSEVLCEVIEADDFEAMRQTYKRNQHGTHNPILLGRMFRKMMETQELSQRELATTMAISEGTVRNALAYAQAADLRNSYAFDRLSIRQVRTYLMLPAPVRDVWLDAGADLHKLDEALRVKMCANSLEDKWEVEELDPSCFREVVEAGLAETLVAKDFVNSVHRAFQLFNWYRLYERFYPGIISYVQAVARLYLPMRLLYELPATVDDNGQGKIRLSPEQWEAILADCNQRADGMQELGAMLKASIRLALRQAGIVLEDVADPRIAEVLDKLRDAPDFIRDADLSLSDKWVLACASADVPDDLLLKAKQRACETLRARDGWFSGTAESVIEDKELLADVRARWGIITAQKAFSDAVGWVMHDHKLAERSALFADRERLMAEVIERQKRYYFVREEKIDGRPVYEVMQERFSRLPWPEFVFLAAYVTGNEMAADGFWNMALSEEKSESEAGE